MTVTETSRIAYFKSVLKGNTGSQKRRIMSFMLAVKRPVTRQDIADFTGIALHTVCARVKGLIGDDKDNPDYIKVHHKAVDPRTSYDGKVEYLVPMTDEWEKRKRFNGTPTVPVRDSFAAEVRGRQGSRRR